ncbi:MAG TPA: SLC13 family permease, partial [Aestuariivirgaceae bacterium]|nr:SLC13 family permease [Aestuariivirgaceae bacterium]
MTIPVAVFLLVYLGMALGRVPGLALDRTGIALLGMIVLVGTNAMTLGDVGEAVDTPTIALLFALMIISAQFEQAGFYGWIADRVTGTARRPRVLLAAVIAFAGVLSALLTNDVVVFALTPPLCAGLKALKIDARPYLIGVAAAANSGSAATLIGNPQNILIGQSGDLDFWRYLLMAAPPSLAALVVTFVVIVLTWKLAVPQAPGEAGRAELDRYQLAKAVVAVIALICMFATSVPHEVSALAVAGVLLLSRRLSSRDMIG